MTILKDDLHVCYKWARIDVKSLTAEQLCMKSSYDMTPSPSISSLWNVWHHSYCTTLMWTKFSASSVLTFSIHGTALAPHCRKAMHARINRNIENSTPYKTVNPENFGSTLCTHDYVRDGNYCTNFGANRFSGGFSPSRWYTAAILKIAMNF